jgi:hypothetical protein
MATPKNGGTLSRPILMAYHVEPQISEMRINPPTISNFSDFIDFYALSNE